MNAQHKIEEAKAKFRKGTKFLSVNYPQWDELNVQVEEGIIWKERIPNLLWVKAQTPMNVVMDVVIYDANTDTWGSFVPFVKEPVKEKVYVNPLQIKKGDFVLCNDGFKGTITKYPSNTAIVIEDPMGNTVTVDKNMIKTVFSNAK